MDADKLLRWVKGNAAAYDFLCAYGDASQALDDLCDNDTDANRSALCTMVVERIMGGMWCNPFFQSHSAALTPIMLNGLLEWDASNTPTENETLQTFHYVRRESGDALIVMCAYIIGGREWSRDVAVDVLTYLHGRQESVEEWKNNG